MHSFYVIETIEKLSLYGAFQSIQISVAALMFNLLLYIIVEAQRTWHHQKRREFASVVLAVMFANAATCLWVFLTYADIGIPDVYICVMQAVVFMSNTLVCYHVASYVRNLLHPANGAPDKMPLFNRLMVPLQALILIAWLSFAIPYILREGVLIRIDGLLYIVTGFVMELIHLVYAVLLFLRAGSSVSFRVKLTAAASFFLTILTVAIQGFLGESPLINYLGATLGLFVFYFSVETPDYISLSNTLTLLTEAQKKAEAANDAKSEFLANMSHEIRTPLSAVLGMNEMVLRESTEPEILSYARSVERAGHSLLAVINDVLDFSKIESGRMTLTDKPYRLSALLHDACNMTLFRATEKGLKFVTEVEETIPGMLLGDEVRIRQIISNLLNNAVKYTHDGSVTLAVKGEMTGEDEVMLTISVSDTGIGIKPEDMSRLFAKFERLDMEKNNTVTGSGLGLAIVKQLTTLMGGEIEVKSAYGEGSTFTVTIPQKITDHEPVGHFQADLVEAAEYTGPYRVSFTAPGARILVVDDTEINLTVIRKLLKKTQMIIDTASGGLQALSLTQDTPYDMIFMDQRMPEMDGERTLGHIRSQAGGANAKTPVVCLTADATENAQERYIAMGFSDYLSKPVDAKKLEETVRHYLPEDKLGSGEDAAPAGGEETTSAAPDEKTLRAFYESADALSFRIALTNCLDAETLYEILLEYDRTITDNAETIRRATEEEDLETYTIRMHALKSASRMIGAMELSEQALLLEQAGNDRDLEKIRKETPALLTEYLSLKELLSPLLGR